MNDTEAAYDSECAACGGRITVGQHIIPAEAGGWGDGWVHAHCPRPATVCDKCWLEEPCGCDE
jgi:hypothetical protein